MNVDFVNWIMGCIWSASFAVLINGAPSDFFHPTRGLRQGCPLSPFLFLLIAEALSCIINQACCSGAFKGIPIAGNEILTHILFVDDILLSGSATKDNASSLAKSLDLFQKATGMLINLEKSCLIHNLVSDTLLAEIRSSLPFAVSNWVDGFKYLGFTLKPNSYGFKDWKWLYQKVENWIKLWTNRCLSRGGRSVLIKSIL